MREFNEENVRIEFKERTGLEVGKIKEDNLSDSNRGDIIYFEIETPRIRISNSSSNNSIAKTIETVKAELRKVGINNQSITSLKSIGYKALEALFKKKSPESLDIGLHEVLNCLYHLIESKEEYNSRYIRKLKALWKNKPLEDTNEDFHEEYREFLIVKNTDEAEIMARLRFKEDLENEPETYFNDWVKARLQQITKEDFKENPDCKDVYDIVASDAVSVDGFAHFLNTYDGDYQVTDSNFVIMRMS